MNAESQRIAGDLVELWIDRERRIRQAAISGGEFWSVAADEIAVARRELQEAFGLVLNSEQVSNIVDRNNKAT